jgi:diacylglycerol O-acyltransferase
LFDRVFGPAQQAMSQSATVVNAAVQGGVDLLRHPSHVLDLTQLAVRSVGVAVGTLLKTPDPTSLLKGRQGTHKRVAWSQPVTLTDVRAIGAATGGKVNDVLVGAMAGALRHYMQERGAAVDGMVIRGVVPVDLRPPDRALELGNHFGLTFLDLPVGVSGSLERLQRTKHAMDAIKHSPEAAVFMGIIGIIGQTPKRIEDIAVSIFGSKATLVMTNVAGPRETLYVAGRAIKQMMFWVPHPGSLGMGISILSYKGMATVGVVADAGLVPDPEQITARFEQEFAHLLAMADAKASTAHAAAQPLPHCAAKTASGRPCRNYPWPVPRIVAFISIDWGVGCRM